MLLKLNEPLVIEDMRHIPADGKGRLRELLLRGAAARPDPNRKDFYDIEDRFQVFYIHICPNRKVLLLAVWAKEDAAIHVLSAAHMARTSAA